MKLSTQITLSILVLVLMAFLIEYLSTDYFFEQTVEQIERNEILLAKFRIETSFESLKSELGAKALEWAYWEDPFDYVSGVQNGFIEKSLSDQDEFSDNHVNYMILVDKAGKSFFNREFFRDGSPFKTAPEDLVRDLLANTMANKGDTFTDFFNLSTGETVILSSSGLLNPSHLEKPFNGFIIFGLKIEPALLADIESSTGIKIAMQTLSVTENFESYKIISQDEKKLQFAFHLQNAKKQNLVTILAEMPRPYNVLSEQFKTQKKKSSLLSLFGSLLVLILIIHLALTRRLKKLQQEVLKTLTVSDHYIAVAGKDEIAQIFEAINEFKRKLLSVDNKKHPLSIEAQKLLPRIEKIKQSLESAERTSILEANLSSIEKLINSLKKLESELK